MSKAERNEGQKVKDVKGLEDLRAEMEYKSAVLAAHPRNVQVRREEAERKREAQEAVPAEIALDIVPVTPELVRDLGHLVATGEDPSPELDSALKKDPSLYARLADFYEKEAKRTKSHFFERPLIEAAMNGYFDTVQYLIEHGAVCDYGDDLRKKTDFFYSISRCNLDIFQCVWDKGRYGDIFSTSPRAITELCGSASDFRIYLSAAAIVFDSFEEKKISPSPESCDVHLRNSALYNNLPSVQFYHRRGADIARSLEHRENIMSLSIGNDGHLDVLKYLINSYLYKHKLEKIDFQMHILLEASARNGHLQMVHYLLTHYHYSPEAISEAEQKAQDHVKKYFSYYKDPASTPIQELVALETSEVKKMWDDHHHLLLSDVSMSMFFDKEHVYRLMHLALTSVEEAKQAVLPRLTAISELPPLNHYAIVYACQKLQYSSINKTDKDEILSELAKAYREYTKATDHIDDALTHKHVIMHEHFSRSFMSTEKDRGGFFTALQAVVTGLTLSPTEGIQLLPRDLSQIVALYITVESTIITPSLIHIWRALHSKGDRCDECKQPLSSSRHLIHNNKHGQIPQPSAVIPPPSALAPANERLRH